MSTRQWALLVACLLLLAPLWLQLWRTLRWRRRRRGYRRFPASWRMQLARDSALYRRVPEPLRTRTELRAQEFLDRHRLVGCAGLRVTPPMARLVAFQACLLVAGRSLAEYDGLGEILLYPDEFLVERSSVDEAGVVSTGREPLAGESIDTARIVLSWADVRAAGSTPEGDNVVVHEFAHFLDHSRGGALSAPDDPALRELLAAELAALRAGSESGGQTLIDGYGGEDPAEFFAVASETFLERSAALRARHPQLYRALAALYGLEPADWPGSAA